MTTVAAMVVVSLFIASCGGDKEKLLDIRYDPEIVPSMITDTVFTFISDSGITRYKLVADLWEVYDKAKEPYWFFPKGFYLERFNEDYFIEATVLSDTAWYFTRKELWQCRGNVRVQNIVGDRFRSEELFWDQKTKKVYSDKFIEIEKEDGLFLRGYGFSSNQEMTSYQIFHPHDSRIPLRDDEEIDVDAGAEELPDSTQTGP